MPATLESLEATINGLADNVVQWRNETNDRLDKVDTRLREVEQQSAVGAGLAGIILRLDKEGRETQEEVARLQERQGILAVIQVAVSAGFAAVSGALSRWVR